MRLINIKYWFNSKLGFETKLSTMYRMAIDKVESQNIDLDTHGLCNLLYKLDISCEDHDKLLSHFRRQRPSPTLHKKFYHKDSENSAYWFPFNHENDMYYLGYKAYNVGESMAIKEKNERLPFLKELAYQCEIDEDLKKLKYNFIKIL